MTVVFCLNGPNLNMLGKREPEIYGLHTLADIRKLAEARAKELSVKLDFRQTNHEGVLVDWLHEADAAAEAVILNAAAYTRTSLAVLDAMKAIRPPVIEIHLSNIAKRESYRPPSIISHGAVGMISGFGPFGYVLAVDAAAHLAGERREGAPRTASAPAR